MTANRRTPTTANYGATIGEKTYADLVNEEVTKLWQASAVFLGSIGGTANAITAVCDTPITTYAKNQSFWLVPDSTNTSGVTIIIDGVGLRDVTDYKATPLANGALVAGSLYLLVDDGTRLRVMSGGASVAGSSSAPDIILQDQKSAGTNAGTATAGSWFTRTLNTAVRNVVVGSSLSSNEITLPAGSYYFRFRVPGFSVNRHQCRLYNVTDASVVAYGSSLYSANEQVDSAGGCYVTITATKAFRLEQRVETGVASSGLGVAVNFSSTEVYAELNIYKIGASNNQIYGQPGGAITFAQTFDGASVADSDPGTGKIRFNNATSSSVSVIFCDLLAYNLTDITTILDQLPNSTSTIKGQLRLVKSDDDSRWMVFNMTAWTTASGYRKLTVTYVSQSGANPFTTGDLLYFNFVRTPDAGGTNGANSDNQWAFETSTTMASPSTGGIRLNNASLASVTSIAMHAQAVDTGNPNLRAYINTWDDSTTTTSRGYVIIRKAAARENFAIYSVNGAITDNVSWLQLPLTYITHSGSFSAADNLLVQFVRTGDKGATGAGTGDLLASQNLNDLSNKTTAITNLFGASATGTGGVVRRISPTIQGAVGTTAAVIQGAAAQFTFDFVGSGVSYFDASGFYLRYPGGVSGAWGSIFPGAIAVGGGGASGYNFFTLNNDIPNTLNFGLGGSTSPLPNLFFITTNIFGTIFTCNITSGAINLYSTEDAINTTTGAIRVSGGGSFLKTVYIGGDLILNKATVNVELGAKNSINAPLIDFNSSGNNNDFDARIIANGGGGASGLGTLTFSMALLTLTGAFTSTHATGGIGYGTGAGGTVAQATSKATGVTLNKVSGQITMNNAALAAGAKVSFVVTNSAVAATDVPIVSIQSGGTANAYRAAVTAIAAGSFTVTVENITGGSLSESPVVQFTLLKAVNA